MEVWTDYVVHKSRCGKSSAHGRSPTMPYLGSYSDRARYAPVNGMYRGRQICKDYENRTLPNDLMPATCQPWRRPKEELWASTQKLPVGHTHGACVRIGRARLSSLWRADENTCCHRLSGCHPEDFDQPWPPHESPAHRPRGIGPRHGVRMGRYGRRAPAAGVEGGLIDFSRLPRSAVTS